MLEGAGVGKVECGDAKTGIVSVPALPALPGLPVPLAVPVPGPPNPVDSSTLIHRYVIILHESDTGYIPLDRNRFRGYHICNVYLYLFMSFRFFLQRVVVTYPA